MVGWWRWKPCAEFLYFIFHFFGQGRLLCEGKGEVRQPWVTRHGSSHVLSGWEDSFKWQDLGVLGFLWTEIFSPMIRKWQCISIYWLDSPTDEVHVSRWGPCDAKDDRNLLLRFADMLIWVYGCFFGELGSPWGLSDKWVEPRLEGPLLAITWWTVIGPLTVTRKVKPHRIRTFLSPDSLKEFLTKLSKLGVFFYMMWHFVRWHS